MAEANRKKSKLPPIPPRLIYVIIISVVASWVPLSLIALHRVQNSERPRIHIFQDMGVQPRSQAQATSPLFTDGRAMRLPVADTVARGELRDDDHYYRGYRADDNLNPITEGGEPDWYDGLPEQIELSRELLQRGQARYNIACAPCHGTAGYGDGLVHQRVTNLIEVAARENRENPANWVPPVSLHQIDADGLIYGPERYAAGKLFHVISEGWSTMPAYKEQLSVADRWAVVAYVHALQLSQTFPVDQLPDDVTTLADPIDPVPTVAEVGTDVGEIDQETLADPQLIATGQQLFQSKICFTCHQVDENVPVANPLPGPTFVGGIFGLEREVEIGIGGPTETIVIDEEYFIESIRQPQAKITKGYGPPRIMPPVPVTDEEMVALIAYVKSLGTHDNGDANGND